MVNNQANLHQERFTLEVWRDGICQLKPHSALTLLLVEDLVRATQKLIESNDRVCGIVLDMRGHYPLSIVRLSRLVDHLSKLGLPLVVLFKEARHQHIADLLHNTLAHKTRVAYTTDPVQARAHIKGDPDNHRPPHPDYLYR